MAIVEASAAPNMGPALDKLHSDLAEAHVLPTWIYAPKIVSVEPNVDFRPFIWKWDRMHDLLMRAGELVTPGRGAERRSIDHINPDLTESASHTLATAIQLVRPGEVAPAHRHVAGAIRFIIDSAGGEVYTRVNGEKLYMETFDLVMTPKWTWHDHLNESDNDILWLDALDYPFVNMLRTSFFELFDGNEQPTTKPTGFTESYIGRARPADWKSYPNEVPLVRYKWGETKALLEDMRGQDGSPHDGVLLEYVNPFNSGPALPTMCCFVQLLRPREHTQSHRATTSTVYYVMDGEGFSIIDGIRFDWAKGDVFVVPPWSWHEHANGTGDDALLFSVSDRPILETFGYYREQVLEDNGGHQEVTSTHTP